MSSLLLQATALTWKQEAAAAEEEEEEINAALRTFFPMRGLKKSSGSSTKTHLLWKDFFTNPTQWYDNRNTKSTSKSPDFRNTMTRESLWIDGLYNPHWIHEDLRRRRTFLVTEQCKEINRNGNHKQDFIVMAVLKACARKKDICEGIRLHNQLLKKKILGNNPFIASALISMYAKCGMIVKAQKVLDELPFRDVVSWSALISGYSQHGQDHRALICFEQMQNEGISPDVVTFSCVLKACGRTGSLHKGENIHEEIVSKGLLERNIILGNVLVDMYTRCGVLEKAHKVLIELPVRDVVSWSTLIAGYAECGRYHEALLCFDQMLSEGISPNSITFTCILKACGSIGAIDKGKQIHEEITTMGLLKNDIVLGNALVDMYAKCGAFRKAQKVLMEIPIRNALSWNALMAGYVQQGQCHEALNCLQQMQRDSLSPNLSTYLCIIKACGNIGAIDNGKLLHHEILTKGMLGKDSLLGSALIGMYAKCGMLRKAQDVFEELPVQDVASWSALISGYAHEGQCHEALLCFKQMRSCGLSPDVVTFICILKACGYARAINEGKLIHDEVVDEGLLDKDIALGTALVDMYAKCGMLGKAQQVLEELVACNEATWNALIAGYVEQGQCLDALSCFEQMQRQGHYASTITYTCILKACGSVGALDSGKQIHDEILSKGLLENDTVLGNALVDMYAKCGFPEKAQKVLEDLHVQDAVSWNALITGFVQQELCHEALFCFKQMQNKGFSSDEVTLICILKACGSTGAINTGKQIHGDILRRGLLDKDIVLGGALVDMYAKCGMLALAQYVLEELPFRNIVSWSSLIAGYAHQGKGYEALKCFERMQSEGIDPNNVTFLCILTACSRTGLWDEGNSLFESMTSKYGIIASVEHRNCIASFLGFIGHFDKAMLLTQMIPRDYDVLWLALLSACRKWGNLKLANLVFDQAKKLKKGWGSAYVLMGNVSANLGDQKEAGNINPSCLHFDALVKQGNNLWFNARLENAKHSPSKDIYEEMETVTFQMSRVQNSRCNRKSVLGELTNFSGHHYKMKMICDHSIVPHYK